MIHEVTKARIAARCEAYNKAHKLIKEHYPTMKAWADSLIGQKIYKVNGTLMEKFQKTKPIILGLPIICSDYSIRVEPQNIGASQNYINHRGENDTVHESGGFSAYLCDVMDGVAIANPNYATTDHLRTDYDPQEIIDALDILEEIEKRVSSVTNGLHHCISARLTINHP